MVMMFLDVCVVCVIMRAKERGECFILFFSRQTQCSSKEYGLMSLQFGLKFGLRECFFLTLESKKGWTNTLNTKTLNWGEGKQKIRTVFLLRIQRVPTSRARANTHAFTRFARDFDDDDDKKSFFCRFSLVVVVLLSLRFGRVRV